MLIGANVVVTSVTHPTTIEDRHKDLPGCIAPVKLGKNCWLGAGSIVLPGVTVGENSIIAAGAVLTKDAEPNALYAGVPARKVKSLT